MSYQAFPLEVHSHTPHTVAKVHRMLQTMIQHPTFFTDFQTGCKASCGGCEACLACKRTIASKLLAPQALAWEVWKLGEAGELLDFVGILRVSNRVDGDATIHYYFFDGKLRDKTDLLLGWIAWLLSDSPDWKALHRLTTEIPADAFAFARHAARYLGFGGPFRLERNGASVPVEGIKREALTRDSKKQDVLILGLVNGEEKREGQA